MLDKFLSDISKIFLSPGSQLVLVITAVLISTVIITIAFRKMDLMRFIQECKGGSQGSIENKEKLKEIYKQKDNHIKKLEIRIRELEQEVVDLERKNQDCLSKVRLGDGENKEILTMLKRYEDLISKVMTDNDVMRQEKILSKQHLDNLENSFKDLLEKYEKAKSVIEGLRENETGLYTQKEKYENVIKMLESKLVNERMKNNKMNVHTIRNLGLTDEIQRCPSKTSGNKGDYRLLRKPSGHR